MALETIDSNWFASAQSKLACGITNFTEFELLSIYVGELLAYYDLANPNLIVSVSSPDGNQTISEVNTLKSIQDKINCGDLISYQEALFASSVVYKYLKDNYVAPQTPSHFIFAAGNYTWTGTGTTNSIAVVGLLATDVIQTTLIARDAAQTLDLSVNNAASDTIDLTLSAAGSVTCKVAYSVLRVIP